MIILTSNGLSNISLINETKKYLDNNYKKAVIITTASVEYKAEDHNIPAITESLLALGLEVDCFDIEFEDVKLLNKYDLMLINGGNPFHLLNYIRLTNSANIIADFALNKVLIGISAGSIVLGQNLDLVLKFNPEMNNIPKLIDCTALNLTSINIAPHYTRYQDRYENLEKRIAKFEKENDIEYVRLNDGDAIFIASDTHEE